MLKNTLNIVCQKLEIINTNFSYGNYFVDKEVLVNSEGSLLYLNI